MRGCVEDFIIYSGNEIFSLDMYLTKGFTALFPAGECWVHTQARYDFYLASRPKNTSYDVESVLLRLGSKQVNTPLESCEPL